MQHAWKFMRAGGVDQIVIRSGADIIHLDQLDQKLWVALACPTRGVHFDPATLDLLDSDDDGRIRPPEVIAAAKWAEAHFRDPDGLLEPSDRVTLGAIRDDTPEGAALIEEARRSLDLASGDAFTLQDILERERSFAALPFNGDGVVRADSTDDEAVRAVIAEIIEAHGGVPDRNGEPGIDRARLDAFFGDAAALIAWRERLGREGRTLPLGEKTLTAAAAAAAVRDKVQDYFVRTRLAAYDASAAPALGPSHEDYRALAGTTLDENAGAVAALPLAAIEAGRPLPLREGVNPAWAQKMEALRVEALEPLLGREVRELTEDEWRAVERRLEPCVTWLEKKPDTKLGNLDIARVREIVAGGARAAIEALIARDEAAKERCVRLEALEKLARFKRDLLLFLNNFVSFAEFYSRRGAIFEAGTLYLDQRSCELTVEVDDAGKHASLAGLAKAYLAYCDCTRGAEKKTIVSAFTAGDVDFLLVGRNGVFYDRAGRDWDAKITKVIENPISVRQAFFSPYKKFVRMIEEQVAKRAAAADAGAQGKLSALAGAMVKPDRTPAPAAPAGRAPLQRRIDVGTVAALGVAFGSISTLLVALFSKFVELGWWIPVGLLGIVLAISGPSMVIAGLKLRQRSLGPILDASGWAINGRMRINVPLGATLSRTAKMPRGARRLGPDLFTESRIGRYVVLLLAVTALAAAIAWRLQAGGP